MFSPRTRRQLEYIYAELRWRIYEHNPLQFFREVIYIKAPDAPRGRVLFELFDYQEDDLQKVLDNRYVIILKARQLGLTTLMMAYAFWMLMTKPGTNIVLVSKDKDTAESALAEHIDFFWRFMPTWTHERRPDLVIDNAGEHVWQFPDGMTSRIQSFAPTKSAGAGETATLVLWDEAALPDVKAPGIGDDIYKSLSPTTDRGGQMVIFSTARGAHNRFAQLYQAAMRENESVFVPIFHPWYLSRFTNPLAEEVRTCPNGYCDRCVDDRIYKGKMLDFADSPWEFFSEYPRTAEEAFRKSGRTRFRDLPPVEEFDDLPWRGTIRMSASGEVILALDPEGPLRLAADFAAKRQAPVWSKPIIAMDPAGGRGGDYTAAIMGWMGQDGVPEIKGYWHSNEIESPEATRQIAALGRVATSGDGRPALMAVEVAGGWGETPIYILSEEENYRNLYVHRDTSRRDFKREYKLGFPMNEGRRHLVIDTLSKWLRFDLQEQLDVLRGIPPLLRHELGAFVVGSDGKPRADVGMHDDLVMATAVWLYVMEQMGLPGATPEPKSKKPPLEPGRMSVAHIFEEAERARGGKSVDQMESDREFARQLTRGRA